MNNKVYRQTGLYDAIRIENDILLIPLNGCENKKAVLLNETSAKIFGYLQEEKGEIEIAELLFEQFDVERSQIEKDIINCIKRLISLHVIDMYKG